MASDVQRALVIVGAGGHGRVILDAARASGQPVKGYLDNTRAVGDSVNDCPVLGPTDLLSDRAFLSEVEVIVALGRQSARRGFSTLVMENGGVLASVWHPTTVVSPYASIGAGTYLAPGSIVTSNAIVGKFCILNTGCSIDHDANLADGVQICPGARLAGAVTCGEDSFIGTGAVIIPNVRIGTRSVVAAGAVVIKHVPSGATAAGNPARIISDG